LTTLQPFSAKCQGFVVVGLMLTDDGPRVLEFNARFGDPETQVLMPRLQGDLLELLADTARGDLAQPVVAADQSAAVTVVLASPGYPESSDYGGAAIEGLEAAEANGALVFQGGTAVRNGRVVTMGGRIVSVTGTGTSVAEARAHAYRAVELVSFEGAQYRRDIAAAVDG